MRSTPQNPSNAASSNVLAPDGQPHAATRAAARSVTRRTILLSVRHATLGLFALGTVAACGKASTQTSTQTSTPTSTQTGTPTSTQTSTQTSIQGPTMTSNPATSAAPNAVSAAPPTRQWKGKATPELSALAARLNTYAAAHKDEVLGVALGADYSKVEVYALDTPANRAAVNDVAGDDSALVAFTPTIHSYEAIEKGANAALALNWQDLGIVSINPGIISQSVEVTALDGAIPATTERGKRLIAALEKLASEHSVPVTIVTGTMPEAY